MFADAPRAKAASLFSGDGAASKSMGLFGVVSGAVKKKKLAPTFKQKRRKAAKQLRGVARREMESTKATGHERRTARKKELKTLW